MEQLLTRVVGFSGAAGELFFGSESFRRHSVGGSCLQISLCFIPLSRDGGGVILKSLMCLGESFLWHARSTLICEKLSYSEAYADWNTGLFLPY